MAKYSFSKVGTIFAEDYSGANQIGGFYATLLDTSDVPNWPWVVTLVSGFLHQPGVYLAGAKTDPLTLGDWEVYDVAKARGAFAAWSAATGQALPASNPVYSPNDLESPRVVKVGNTWYMIGHEEAGTIQYSCMYQATGGPLNWSPIANGNSGIIIDPRVEPYYWTPVSDDNRLVAHRGYVTWAPNVFADIPYDYVAYGYSQTNGRLYTTQYGSNNLSTWDVIATLAPLRPFGQHLYNGSPPTGYDHTVGFLADSIRDAGGGEYVVLAGAAVSGNSYKGLVEFYLAADGRTCTRDPELILPLGGAGSDDELRIFPGGILEWEGQILLVYRGQDATAVDVDDPAAGSVMLAVGSYDPNGSKGTARVVPPHDKYVWDGETDTTYPSWFYSSAGTAPTITGGALVFANNGTANNIRMTGTFAKADHEWVEIWFRERHASGDGSSSPSFTKFVQFTEAAGNGQNYLRGYCAQNLLDLNWRYRSLNVDRLNAATTVAWGNIACDWEHGIQWRITDEIAYWVRGPTRTVFDDTNTYRDLSGYTDMAGTDFYWAISTQNTTNPGGQLAIERLEFRAENPAGNTIPSISNATATANSVTLTFSEDCIGDGSGITIKVNGAPVTGTWSRPSLTTAVFTPTATMSGLVSYDISSTDIRNEQDLVRIPDATGVELENVGPVVDSGPSSRQLVGIGGRARSGKTGVFGVGDGTGSGFGAVGNTVGS